MSTTRFSVEGFASESQRDEFADLIHFALYGHVIIGWDELEEGDDGYEDNADSYDDNLVPIYDRTDRSTHQWFALAQMIATVAGNDIIYLDDVSRLVVRAPDNNAALLLEVVVDGLEVSLA